jgi:hypothetical protein
VVCPVQLLGSHEDPRGERLVPGQDLGRVGGKLD